MITSSSNPKIKYARRLQTERRFRTRENKFVIEGSRWFTELFRPARSIEFVLYTENWINSADHAQLLEQFDVNSYLVSDAIMVSVSATKTPPGILAVVPIQHLPIPKKRLFLLILDEVTNPGNLGTILRSASATGVDLVLLGPGCVDAYNPKVVRGGMGAHLRLPIRRANWTEIADWVAGMTVWLAAADGEESYTDVDWCKPSALIIGNEAKGAQNRAAQLADGRVSIPMQQATESLNAAIAASVVLFEAARQKGN